MELIEFAKMLTVLSGGAVIFWKIRSWFKSLIDGLKCQLRSDMLRTYYKCKEKESIRQYELEAFLMSYKAYKALGGNSFIDEVHVEVAKFNVVS